MHFANPIFLALLWNSRGSQDADSMPAKVLLTGRPGCGKTTAVRKIIEQLRVEAGGFYTEEVRQAGVRVGFRLLTLSGDERILARVGGGPGPRVGRYTVDVKAVDELGVMSIERAIDARKLVVIDEIGPMELLSARFRESVVRALESESPVLGTIMWKPSAFTNRLKDRRGVTLVEVTPSSREAVVRQVVDLMRGGLHETGRGGIA